MSSLVDLLDSKPLVIADGATGTNLQARGLEPGSAPEEWVISKPEEVRALHRSFIRAGADFVLTCSFGGNRIRLGRSSVNGRHYEVNRRAAEIAGEAREDAGADVLVGGSMGPTGEMPEPYGSLSLSEIRAAFSEQARALTSGGVDFLALETFYAIEEATAALEGVRSASDLPVILTFSYDRGLRTMMGVTPEQMVEAFKDAGLAAIGANCGTTLENMERIVAKLAAVHSGMPIWAKPNAGVPSGTPPRFPVDPEEMGQFARRLVSAGARVVGGCCGSTPEHIAAIKAALDTWKPPSEP